MDPIVLAILALAVPQEDDRNFELHGFVLGHGAARVSRRGRRRAREGGDFIVAEERLRLDLSAWSDSGDASARAKVDLLHDAITMRPDLDVREVYVDYTAGPVDFRLGRQLVTWGVGDLLFINDVFPKDWVSFFTGRPIEYLKIGVDALRVRLTTEAVNAEVVVTPFFRPDELPSRRRFLFADPFAAIPGRVERRPRPGFGNTEVGLRVYRQLGAFDASLYVSRGFWRTPGMRPEPPAAPTRVRIFYPELSTYGLSLQGQALGGVVSLETGYYDSWDDRDGDDPSVPNSQARFLVGYSRQFGESFTAGLQYYAEVMRRHDAYLRTLPPGFPADGRYRDVLALRLTQLLKHETLKLSLVLFFSPTDRDGLAQPEVAYKFTDSLSGAIGANVFSGRRETTVFGRFQRNDNLYVSVRFDF